MSAKDKRSSSQHHKKVRTIQAKKEKLHHQEKLFQLKRIFTKEKLLKQLSKRITILELFAGVDSPITEFYESLGTVNSYDKLLDTGDSYITFHKLIGERKKYSIIDLDPYGFPSRFFPDIFLLCKDKSYLVVTFPYPSANILNKIKAKHLQIYFGESNPSVTTIITKIKEYGLFHWRKINLVNMITFDKMYRLIFSVKKLNASDYCKSANSKKSKYYNPMNRFMEA